MTASAVNLSDAYGRDDYRDVVMVCGQDPYAHRGQEDLARPYLRPEQR